MCRALHAAYVKSGGGHPEVLAQLAAAEKKAIALLKRQQTNLYQAGIFLFFSYCSLNC